MPTDVAEDGIGKGKTYENHFAKIYSRFLFSSCVASPNIDVVRVHTEQTSCEKTIANEILHNIESFDEDFLYLTTCNRFDSLRFFSFISEHSFISTNKEDRYNKTQRILQS